MIYNLKAYGALLSRRFFGRTIFPGFSLFVIDIVGHVVEIYTPTTRAF
jgi:hypothetical protein